MSYTACIATESIINCTHYDVRTLTTTESHYIGRTQTLGRNRTSNFTYTFIVYLESSFQLQQISGNQLGVLIKYNSVPRFTRH